MATTAREPDFNPYTAPQTEGLGPTDYYRVVSKRIGYVEYWRMANNPWTFFVLALFKTLRIPFPFKQAFCYPHRLSIVEWDRIPEHIRSMWAGPLAEAERLGFRLLFCTATPTLGQCKEAMMAVVLSADAMTCASLTYIRIHVLGRLVEKVALSATSRLPGERWATTSNYRNWLKSMPDAVSRSISTRRTFGEVVEAHRRWLRSRGWETQPIDGTGLAEQSHGREREVIRFHLSRGAFQQMTEREVEAYSRISPHANALALTEADRRFFRVLRFVERFVLVVMFAAVVFLWVRPLLFLLIFFLCSMVLGLLHVVRLAKNRSVRRRS